MNRIVKIFGYQFYVKEFLFILFTYLLMENIFSWLLLPNSVILLAFEKVLGIILFGFVLYHFTNFKLNEQIYVGLFVLIIIRLVFESMFKYGNLFEQLTLFTILFPVIYVIFIKAVCRSLELDLLEFIAKFYLLVYLLVMLIYGRGFSFSLESVEMNDYGPFSGDSRIIHARSVFMMIIPLLWYFNRFLHTLMPKHLLIFVFCLIVILVHQHRSVWASALFSLGVFLVLSVRNRLFNPPKIVNLIIISVIAVSTIAFIWANISPKFVNLFMERFSEILDPTREGGTGRFRADQREVYLKLFLQRPFFGWTFDGFNMPNPLVDWWPAKSGQHFHEGYVEMLFYHGIAGFLLKYWFLFYIAFKAFSKNLGQESIILIAFSLSGLIFSFSYVLPLVFWGHVGLCLYYLEKKAIKEFGEIDDEDSKHPYTNLKLVE